MVRGLLFLCAIVALIAFVAAYALDLKAQQMFWKKRALVAALVGGNLPMLLLGAAFILSGDLRARAIQAYLVLAVFGLLLSAVIGYPIAYLFMRRCERSRQADVFK